MKVRFGLLALLLVTSAAWADTGLVIHGAEFGEARFHRLDNKKHPYPKDNIWNDYVLPDDADGNGPVVVDNPDGSVTIFFLTLEDLITSSIQVAQQKNQPIAVLNVHGHGAPGEMGFPANQEALQSKECEHWRKNALGTDQMNYDKYYSSTTVKEVETMRKFATLPLRDPTPGCGTGLPEWQSEVDQYPDFRSLFTENSQIHFVTCLVGLGEAGQEFTEGIADLLLPHGPNAWVTSSTDFTLGDWSTPQGMRFWDMQTEAQLNHDNELYSRDKQDSEIAQTGTIRWVTYSEDEGWHSTLIGQQYMSLGWQTPEQLQANTPAASEPQMNP